VGLFYSDVHSLLETCVYVLPVDGKSAWGRNHGKYAERKPIMGVWGCTPSDVKGQSTYWGVQGALSPEADEILANKTVSVH